MQRASLKKIIHLFAAFVCVALAVHLRMVNGVLSDPFHHGEYFASLTGLLAPGLDFIPLTIHGALDYLPGKWALFFSDNAHHFLPTWLLYQLLSVLAGGVLLAIAGELTRHVEKRYLLMFAVAVIAPSLVGYRDLFLLLSVYLYLRILRAASPACYALELCFGMVVAFGVFWSFDRGIAAALSLGSACLLHAYFRKQYIVALVVFVVSVIACGFLSPTLSLGNYLDNLFVLIGTASQWSYGLQLYPMLLTGFLLGVTLFSLFVLVVLITPVRLSDPRLPTVLFLMLLCIFFCKIGSNRADTQHIIMGLYPPLLASLYWYGEKHKITRQPSFMWAAGLFLLVFVPLGVSRGVAFIPVLIVLVIMVASLPHRLAPYLRETRVFASLLTLPVISALYAILYGLVHLQFDWMGDIASPPVNTALVAEEVGWVSREIVRSGSTCLFDLSNQGLINGITGLPSCSRFVYPAYAGEQHEQELIAALKSKAPTAVVYASTSWTFAPSGENMHARFKELQAFLQHEYAREQCAHGYCLRYK